MKSNPYTFDGAESTVTWDRRRCIHAEACVHGLPEVFDPARRPWVAPDAADAAALADVVTWCPTGALHLELADGTVPERPDAASVMVSADGPLYLRGDVTIRSAEGDVLLRDTRVALCRCGLTMNAPLCDGSHYQGFEDPAVLPDAASGEGTVVTSITVTPQPNGPLVVEGPFTVEGAGGGQAVRAKAKLCRCGLSDSKPYCDGSHVEGGFLAR